MPAGPWLSLLQRHAHVDWCDVVTGHDFGLLCPSEIQAWLRVQGGGGPAGRRLLELEGPGLEGFEAALWAACAEARGKVPRPGGTAWARGQDRWRVALLKEALRAHADPGALAEAVEAVYERVGCPEDMLPLWRREAPRTADPEVLQRWIVLREGQLARAG